jgi:oligopeptide transport system permease protein
MKQGKAAGGYFLFIIREGLFRLRELWGWRGLVVIVIGFTMVLDSYSESGASGTYMQGVGMLWLVLLFPPRMGKLLYLLPFSKKERKQYLGTYTAIYWTFLLMVVMGSGLKSIIIAMGLTYWTGMARIVRSQVLAMREQEFVSAAILLGVPTHKLLTRQLIPNAMGPIMVSLTMQIPSAMFTEAFLSFIGLGVSKPMASWGSLANAALPALYTNPYQLFYPALVMSITILALNLFSDGLRDSLDPRLRK